ncbi:MAG: hypothetical protein QOF58_636 [Pseudonocardiales bacterium]|nr:hypothetical protein [Pseudonocardiales bacterium]
MTERVAHRVAQPQQEPRSGLGQHPGQLLGPDRDHRSSPPAAPDNSATQIGTGGRERSGWRMYGVAHRRMRTAATTGQVPSAAGEAAVALAILGPGRVHRRRRGHEMGACRGGLGALRPSSRPRANRSGRRLRCHLIRSSLTALYRRRYTRTQLPRKAAKRHARLPHDICRSPIRRDEGGGTHLHPGSERSGLRPRSAFARPLDLRVEGRQTALGPLTTTLLRLSPPTPPARRARRPPTRAIPAGIRVGLN